jgi:hypothetical protein
MLFSAGQSATFGGVPLSFVGYIKLLFAGFPHDVLWLLPVQVMIALLGLGYRPLRPLLCLLPAQLLIGYFQFLRFYSHTSVETTLFVVFSFGFMAVCLRAPLAKFMAKSSLHFSRYLRAAQIFLLLVITVSLSQTLPVSYVSYRDQQLPNLHAFEALNASPLVAKKQVYYLAPGNENRFLSIYSAMCKGGTDIFTNTWGKDSPYMAQTFPWFKCAVHNTGLDFSGSDVLIFRRANDTTIAQALAYAQEHFKTPITGWQCRDIGPVPLGSIVACGHAPQ